jgi:D-3-phosphoglycerate dehydrogenase
MKVLAADAIDPQGIKFLQEHGIDVHVNAGLSAPELEALIPEYEALVVRSQTKVTQAVLEAGKRLQVVGRAGVGVDNIDVETATRCGILVVNAPTANIVAAAEHTWALLLAMARHVPQAHRSLKDGEWSRAKFTGTQLRGKALGIIGMGKVGSLVAKRAQAFDMRVLANDPFVSAQHAESLDVELVSKEELLAQADFLTIHVPMTASTKKLLGDDELKKVKPGMRIINAARGGIIDEQALYEAVEDGRVAGAAVDVFSEEPAHNSPLLKSDRIIVTPHLGASTVEAQTEVSIEVAEQVLSVLRGLPAQHAVNAPMVLPEAQVLLGPFVDLGTLIAKVATQLAEGQLQSVVVTYSGEIAQHDTQFLRASVIRGLLEPISDERVNVLNADLIASQRGMKIDEVLEETPETYRNLLTVQLTTASGTTTVAGTAVFGQSHIVQVDDYRLDITAGDGSMLLIENQDHPGVIGIVGTITGKADVNISFMEVGRLERRGRAIMAVGTDEPMGEAAIASLLEVPGILTVRQVSV